MIDEDGYRANVAIVLTNDDGKVFWAKRKGQDAWQFPQGGIDEGESPEQAMYRELNEEIGLLPEHVEVIGRTEDWLRYDIPANLIRQRAIPKCIGQKQIWFLLRMLVSDEKVVLDNFDQVEFDQWVWVDYWYPKDQVIEFKQGVYFQALQELSFHRSE